MKNLLLILLTLLLHSCSNETKSTNNKVPEINKNVKNEIPPNGTYIYDIAFAEWGGKSMGEKVTVIIKEDSVNIIYDGGGNLSLTKKGEVIDRGILRKHVSGKWIISQSKEDIFAEEIGGCSGGPSIIEFKKKKYWIC
ncbi:MAG: hypothetical protein ACPGSO_06850 [Vicingaceae bacterium]